MAGMPPKPGYADMLAASAPPPMPMPMPMPPGMPGAIPGAGGAPPPTMVGKIPTGMGGVPNKVALGTAIQALREVKSQHPESADEIDGWIASLQARANPDAKKPGAGMPAEEPGPPPPPGM